MYELFNEPQETAPPAYVIYVWEENIDLVNICALESHNMKESAPVENYHHYSHLYTRATWDLNVIAFLYPRAVHLVKICRQVCDSGSVPCSVDTVMYLEI